MSPYEQEFQLENTRAINTVEQVKRYKALLEKTLDYMGAENLRKLQELRENAEANPTDLFVFIEQLHAQNQAFNFKEKIKQLEELGYLLSEPYFSRIDLANVVNNKVDQIYIGKFGLTLGVGEKPLITDWRAKIASVYYKYRYPQKGVVYDTQDGQVMRDLLLKRTFEFDSGTLIKFYNNDIQLDENELISDKIAKRTGGVLEDIVATIQQSQMDIIEQDPRGVCIVQGCVGSGKSTVAIHKLSHIFFNYPDLIHPQNSLLVAKNQILVGYLSTLFPKLGIFDLNYGTLKDLIIRIVFRHGIKLALDLDNELGMDQVDMKLVNLLRDKVAEAKKKARLQIDRLQENPLYSSYFSFVYDDELSIQENVLSVVNDLEEEIKYQKERLDEGLSGTAEVRAQTTIKNIKSLVREVRKISNTLRTTLFPPLIKELGINPKEKLGYKDALVYCFLYAEFFGLPEFKRFEYCVVDEGQDFSVLEYLLLNKLVIKGRFCILGDLNQSYLKTGLTDWNDIAQVITEAKECKKFELTTNYRSTKQIIDYACALISKFTTDFLLQSISRVGPEVRIVDALDDFTQLSTTASSGTPESQANLLVSSANQSTDMLLNMLSDDIKELNKSVGVICFNRVHFDKLSADLEFKYRAVLKEKLVILNPKDRIFYTPKGVYLTMFENCKGLEFAKVYVLGMSKTPKDLHEAKMNYVAVTRAMNELVVIQ